jgi:hypothetical protein
MAKVSKFAQLQRGEYSDYSILDRDIVQSCGWMLSLCLQGTVALYSSSNLKDCRKVDTAAVRIRMLAVEKVFISASRIGAR